MNDYWCIFIDPNTLIIRCERVNGSTFADADADAANRFPFIKKPGFTYCISDKAHKKESCMEISRIGSRM